MSSTDLESLERAAPRPSCRRMDACLIGSVVTLFALVLAGFVVAVLFARNLMSDMKQLHPSAESSALGLGYIRGEDSGSRYKLQNFAYLRATKSALKEGVMGWEHMPYASGTTLGSLYSYDSSQQAITVEHEGSYFLYTQLNLSCTYHCKHGSLTLTFESQDSTNLLSCTVKLPGNNESVVQKCWTVIPRLEKKSRLLARIRSHTDLNYWELDLNSSGFGMFLVDGLGTE